MKNLNLKAIEYKGHKYDFTENYMIIDNIKRVKIGIRKGYSYKLNKTCISCSDGTYGIWALMNDCIKENFALVWVDAITEHALKIAE